MVEGVALELLCGLFVYRGFESLSLRTLTKFINVTDLNVWNKNRYHYSNFDMDSLFLISFFNIEKKIEIYIENSGIKGERNNNFPIPMSTFLFFMKDEKKKSNRFQIYAKCLSVCKMFNRFFTSSTRKCSIFIRSSWLLFKSSNNVCILDFLRQL